MKWARFSPALTREAREKKQLLDKNSKIGIRGDGSIFLKLGKLDWELQFLRVIERDKWKCQGCGAQLNSVTADVDHVLSRGKGGDDSLSNLRLLGNYLSACKCHPKRHVHVMSGKVGT